MVEKGGSDSGRHGIDLPGSFPVRKDSGEGEGEIFGAMARVDRRAGQVLRDGCGGERYPEVS
jgi:hypothetical protein